MRILITGATGFNRVYYAPPFGHLGRLAQALFVKARLREVFAYRSEAIRQRFETG